MAFKRFLNDFFVLSDESDFEILYFDEVQINSN